MSIIIKIHTLNLLSDTLYTLRECLFLFFTNNIRYTTFYAFETREPRKKNRFWYLNNAYIRRIFHIIRRIFALKYLTSHVQNFLSFFLCIVI